MNTPLPPILLGLLFAFAAAPVRAESAAPSVSENVQRMARRVVDSHDNAGLPFLFVDKVNARVFAFDATGQLRAEAPALLGMARGDRLLAPNDMAVDAIPPEEQITPAGRYISRLALDSHGKELLVIDYEASISLHPVVTNKPEERRLERLKSATVSDNRISHGCINVPPEFYSNYVSTAFARTKGVVYILPETKPASELFGARLAGGSAPASATTSGAKSAK